MTKIITSFVYPPLPIRDFDWSAVTDDYDADCDQDGFFSNSPIGYGRTEAEAIADLEEQFERHLILHTLTPSEREPAPTIAGFLASERH